MKNLRIPPSVDRFPVRCGIAVLAGLMYAAAFPPIGWGWLVIPAIALLLATLAGRNGTQARTLGFLFGLVAFGVSLSWLWRIFGPLAILLWCILAAFVALFAEMQGRAARRGISGWRFAVFTAVNWAGWEFIRAELFPLSFPWMTPGLALGPSRLLPWIGVYGAGAIAVLAAVFLAMRNWESALAIIAILAAAAWWKPALPTGGNFVKAAGLQFENVPISDLLAETRKLPADVDYVVWPEYAVPYDIRENRRDWELVQNLCRDRGITLTFGTQNRPAKSGIWRNIALTVDPTGVRGEHTKVHTVHLFDDGVAGTTAAPVPTSFGKTGTPICFDCDYEGIVRRMTAAGAEFFMVPIMDAETWSTREHRQHAELFRIRACENARWLLVAASSGVSQIIDPNGTVRASLGPDVSGAMFGTLRRESRLTFYTRFGWLTPWCLLAVAVGAWLALLFPRREKRSQTSAITIPALRALPEGFVSSNPRS